PSKTTSSTTSTKPCSSSPFSGEMPSDSRQKRRLADERAERHDADFRDRLPDPFVGEHPAHVWPHTADHVDRQQGSPEEDVGKAFPRVAHAAMHLDSRLAHRLSGSGA